MMNFLCWKWHQPGYYTQFTAEHVNVLASMIDRHYDAPHRVLCVTNEPAGIDSSITVIPDRADFADVPSPHGKIWPSCYRRLRLFAPDAGEAFGERYVSLDLDAVITGDLRPLVDRDEDFIGWQDPNRPTQYCGSLIGLRAGSRPDVWEAFDPATSPREAMTAGCVGSDQGWISHCLPSEAQWTRDDGVYSFRKHLDTGNDPLPNNARVVMFHGKFKPWNAEQQRIDWIRENWQ